MLVLSAGFATDASACACCTDAGQRMELAGTLHGYARGEFDGVEFAPTASLFADAGFPDSVEGINEPPDQNYGFALRREENRLAFAFRDAAGRKGSVVFPMPIRLTRFEVDPRTVAELASGHDGRANFDRRT